MLLPYHRLSKKKAPELSPLGTYVVAFAGISEPLKLEPGRVHKVGVGFQLPDLPGMLFVSAASRLSERGILVLDGPLFYKPGQEVSVRVVALKEDQVLQPQEPVVVITWHNVAMVSLNELVEAPEKES